MWLIDRYSQDWAEETLDWMDQLSRRHPEATPYFLMDAAFNKDAVLPFLRTHVAQEHWYALYADAPNASDRVLAVSPILMTLRNLPRDLLIELFRLTDGMPMLSLIITPEPMTALIERLSAFQVVTVQEMRFVLRLSDTRRLPQLVGMLNAQQHAELMGPTLTWYYVDRATRWQSLALPDFVAEPPRRVAFDDEQTADLLEMNTIDALMDTMRREQTACCLDCLSL
ncbi:protein of unknown function [Kushneria avicenniae]|uniref:DUF4123 domain-containing protein n=1 Tax=Kushneria avicenniae TaxID=402385 RepID=A0A1I1K5E2_9GAMM|nr:DUF4123 domain-containing protein [Kushneria avicenniae]SFC53948.1 protein of unknown function [Kushneria avicenniae]